jgi:hypothetical protein
VFGDGVHGLGAVIVKGGDGVRTCAALCLVPHPISCISASALCWWASP